VAGTNDSRVRLEQTRARVAECQRLRFDPISPSPSLHHSRSRRAELAAAEIAARRRMNYSELGYIQAALAFLEANNNLYPDTYARAQKMCEKYDCYRTGGNSLQHGFSMIALASAMDGMLRGISAIESGSEKQH
jgi:hypothetical protein